MNAEVKKLLRGKKACEPESYLWLKKNVKGSKQIGEGEYGKVYRGCVDDKCEKYVVYKEIIMPKLSESNNNVPLARFKNLLNINPKMEFMIAKKLEGFGVPKMYLYKSCDGRDILYSEYIDGKDMVMWMQSSPTLTAIKSVMAQIIYNLYRIQQKYPGFRHHDLHMRNILVRPVPEKDIQIKLKSGSYKISNGGVEAVMIDFGFSVFPRMRNPLVNDNTYKNLGITRNSNKHYDLHFFLTSLHNLAAVTNTRAGLATKIFIENLLAANLLVAQSSLVKNWRLRNKADIPTFETILTKPFFTGKKIQVAIPSTPKRVPVVIAPPRYTSPVNKKEAIARAVAVLKANNKKKKRPLPRPRK